MKETTAAAKRKPEWLFAFGLLAAVLLLFFWRSFVPGLVHFSNDGPLGTLMLDCYRLPQGFTGVWGDLNVIGGASGSIAPDISVFLRWILGPVGFSKYFVAIAIFLPGLGAYYFFRRAGLAFAAASVGAIAVCLNSDFFSTACWGVGTQCVAFGLDFVAMGLVMANRPTTKPILRWLRVILAGFAVGVNVVETADIGALFSMFVAAFAVYEVLTREDGGNVLRIARRVVQVAVIAVMAGLVAYSTVSSLLATQVEGVAGMKQDAQSKAEHWSWATQWSLPKEEAVDVLVGGLFGYRLDGPEGSAYWGRVGGDPSQDAWYANGRQGPMPGGYGRFRGTGEYAGISVVFIAFWAVLQSFRRKDSVFSPQQRKLLWFWSVVVVFSLLFAFGRFAPFYQFLYALPYFSTIRNPVKFMHIFSFALLVLFGYGVDGLWRKYIVANPVGGYAGTFKGWWAKAAAFDKRWVIGSVAFLVASIVGWWVYAGSRQSLLEYLQSVGFGSENGLGQDIATFSVHQVGWYVLFLAISIGLVTLILRGTFTGSKARWAGFLLGGLVLLDLGRNDQHWVKYWDYTQKYATNPIIDLLRDKPYEHRVAILPFQSPHAPYLGQLYRIEWAQHHFMYYNIQSLDIVQMPRLPEDLAAYETALRYDGTSNTLFRVARRWQLTNTRYLLGPTEVRQALNTELDPVQHRFRIVKTFDIVPKPGVTQVTTLEELTAVEKSDGPYALFEFTGALPRASLYTNWEVVTNDQKTLDTIGSESFDPTKTVMISAQTSQTPATNSAPAPATVDYKSYAPKHFVLESKATSPTVLLVNDKFDPNWHVWVDGKPDQVLRCNFIMRGVSLQPGNHTIEFRFQPPVKPLYVSLAAIGVCLLLLGYLVVVGRNDEPPAPTPSAPRQPATAEKTA